jgi:hypothetical protein
MIIGMSEVIQFQRKAVQPASGIRAVRYDGTNESLQAVLEVARLVDSNAVAVAVADLDVAVVRWLRYTDDHAPRIDYEVVERGKWLACSSDYDFIYETDDADLEQWYERKGEA